jgi:hypothetical protein
VNIFSSVKGVESVIHQAFSLLVTPSDSDVWQVRRWWDEKKALVQAQLLAGTYRFRELRRIRGRERVTEY